MASNMIRSFRRNKRQSSSSDSTKHSISRIGSVKSGHSQEIGGLLQSPKKVIKALYDYRPQGPGELKFEKGDFFHVLNEADDVMDESTGWYEATNPMTNAKGMVPVSYFEVFNRSRPTFNGDLISPTQGQRNSNQTLYAVTLYEFKAERDDELDVTPGENLIICAHHDFEWFIAKPITRLGGPGLVPVSYVKVIDMLNPTSSQNFDDDVVKLVNYFKIPTVEQWKDRTAKYQASTIPLGSISNSQAPPANSSTAQFFEKNPMPSNRSSLSSNNMSILEAGVESYQLDNGRYQYLVVAKLSNGKRRYLYRYYQDFYDLQVRLLEMFPYEAGKIENSKRIIPSIPGPLINVNDSISKLRREKLDFYLRNLISLPSHISRSQEVLSLFELYNNGFDKEDSDSVRERNLKRYSQKPYTDDYNRTQSSISSDSVLVRSRSPSAANILNNSMSALTEHNSGGSATAVTTNHEKHSKVKVKFYYEDDIFVLLLPTNLKLQDLKLKLYERLGLNEIASNVKAQEIQLFPKNEYDDYVDEHLIVNDDFSSLQKLQIQQYEIDSDEKFHGSLYDKCKIAILV
ncbi:uncharacterized protein PRCAT00006278001 [Priceomyces carsonii]|uniref:uncharacterized protein n=1 Tax=Priceomyces carsonii TaxID=28549 RepID=UPI002ED98B25|nr:unnamed protein product [Priceomyces carsonii]